MRELALEVLGEVPDQFVDYQVMREQQPERLYKLTEEDHIIVKQHRELLNKHKEKKPQIILSQLTQHDKDKEATQTEL